MTSAPAIRSGGGESSATVWNGISPVYGSGRPGPSAANLYRPPAASTATSTVRAARRRAASGSTSRVVSPYDVHVALGSSGAHGTTNGMVTAACTSGATPRGRP
ncbi:MULTISPECIES: hypothetical protein [unclassified Streptomyces]|uniref:hypothetical protein n=1 Tax=unclassified Streptomyces TaxID=2593676 RepID=UPI0037FE4D0C